MRRIVRRSILPVIAICVGWFLMRFSRILGLTKLESVQTTADVLLGWFISVAGFGLTVLGVVFLARLIPMIWTRIWIRIWIRMRTKKK